MSVIVYAVYWKRIVVTIGVLSMATQTLLKCYSYEKLDFFPEIFFFFFFFLTFTALA